MKIKYYNTVNLDFPKSYVQILQYKKMFLRSTEYKKLKALENNNKNKQENED